MSWLVFPFGLLTTTVLLVLLPDGRPPHRWWWPVVWLMVGWIAVRSVIRLLPGAQPYVTDPPMAEQNSAVHSVQFFFAENFVVFEWVALAAVVHRILITRGPRRAEAIWIFFGAFVYLFGSEIVGSIYSGVPNLMASGISEPVCRAVTIVTGLALAPRLLPSGCCGTADRTATDLRCACSTTAFSVSWSPDAIWR